MVERFSRDPNWKQIHAQMLASQGVNLQEYIDIRRDIHQHAEGAFQEFRTSKLIYDKLLALGLNPSDIRKVAITGLEVNIKGTGKISNNETDKSKPNTIAIRADMDALNMPETTGKPYTSKTEWAHNCGHDGHTVMLLTAAEILIKNRDKIPQGKIVRLLF